MTCIVVTFMWNIFHIKFCNFEILKFWKFEIHWREVLLDFLIRVESELPKSRYVDFRLLVYYTGKHLYDYKSQRFNKYNLQSYLLLSLKKNLDGVLSMDYDFVKVLHSCKSVAHLKVILKIRAVTTDINGVFVSLFIWSYQVNLICGEESDVICQKICIRRPNANANLPARTSDVEDIKVWWWGWFTTEKKKNYKNILHFIFTVMLYSSQSMHKNNLEK